MERAPKNVARGADTAPAALPSITELGRMLAKVSRQQAAIDLLPVAKLPPASEEDRIARLSEDRRRKTADTLLFKRLDALRDLVSALPAKDLSDCVVQLNVASHLMFKITGCDMEKSELDELAEIVERIMVSVMPILAVTAGLDLVEYALDEVVNLHEGRFPELAA